VLVESSALSDLFRFVIVVVAVFVAAMLAKLYHEHKTGSMPKAAAIGSVATYLAVGYAQIIAFSTPGNTTVTLLNVVVLFAVVCSLVGVLKAMDLPLFRRKDK